MQPAVWRLARSAREVAESALRLGVRVSVLAESRAGGPTAQGVMLGYGGSEVAEVARGAETLVAIVGRLARERSPQFAPALDAAPLTKTHRHAAGVTAF